MQKTQQHCGQQLAGIVEDNEQISNQHLGSEGICKEYAASLGTTYKYSLMEIIDEQNKN